MTRTSEEIQQICIRLLDGQTHYQALQVTLDEFDRFYQMMLHLRKTPPQVSLVNLETIIKAQFSDISPQHFDILFRKPLTEQDFEFILNKIWHGSKEPPQRFLAFMREELRQNWLKLSILFVFSLALLYFANSEKLYELVTTLLIQSSTVFLSIYLIFTVIQSQIIYKDTSLFKVGVLQQYFTDDKNVLLLGILTIALTFLNSMFLSLLSTAGLSLPGLVSGERLYWFQISEQVLKALSTTIVIVLLFDTFLIVANYYLERSRDVVERDIASEILHQDYLRFSGDQTQDGSNGQM